jgi:hypothetical protein
MEEGSSRNSYRTTKRVYAFIEDIQGGRYSTPLEGFTRCQVEILYSRSKTPRVYCTKSLLHTNSTLPQIDWNDGGTLLFMPYSHVTGRDQSGRRK